MTKRQQGVQEVWDEGDVQDSGRRDDAEAAGLTTADLAAAAKGPTESRDVADREFEGNLEEAGEDLVDGQAVSDKERFAPLLPQDEMEASRTRWQTIQVAFVDEPRRSVKEADQLVADLMGQLAKSFSEERTRLESQWDRGDDVSTEDLRIALQRYRSFFERLLAA